MELFQVLSKQNELTSGLLEKVELYRSDPHCAKIKPE
jgi:hypothetical protein